jgi:hypothetical protein
MKIKTDIGVMLPEAKECQEPLQAGKGKEGFFSRLLQREHGTDDTLISDFWPSG